ncbi:MAG: CHAP domain-containing protein [Mogibacterium sp.]|nr:CHAP domain-containing protein [Mogibacterium sp.]
MRRRIIVIIMSLLIVVAYTIPAINPEAEVFAASKTQDGAISWVQSQLGQGIDYDGQYGCQCVDLILAYYNALGASPASGNGKDYATNALPSGWTRVQGGTPQKGDILVYGASSNNQYGHVAIYESEYFTYHQNYNSHSYVEKVTNIRYDGFTNPYWGYIRPNWTRWYEPYGPLYLGDDFYARIMLNSKIAVTVDPDTWNVENADMTDTDKNSAKLRAQYWHFIRNDDKSYRILNTYYDEMPLLPTGTTSGCNVKLGVVAYRGDLGQKWILYDPSSLGNGNYIIRSAASEFVLNVHNQGYDPGTNLQIWNYTNSGAEHFLVERHTAAGSTTPAVSGGDANAATTFSWPESSGEVKWYDLMIKKVDSYGNTEKTYNQTGISGTTISVKLPVGNYKAYVVSHSYFNEAIGCEKSFTITCSHSNITVKNAKEATCTADGYTGNKYCSDCGKAISSGSAIPAIGHKLTKTESMPATTTKEGNIEYWSCSVCGKVFSDAEGKEEINQSETVVPKKAVVVGTIAKDKNGNKVKVTSVKSKTVAFTKAKNAKSVVVPATIKINGKTYKVTQINASAFKGSNIRTVTVGKNVKTIKKNAFKGSKATKLILKTKLLKKAKVKGCLKGSKIKTIQVKVGTKKQNQTYVKKYKKFFTKANAGKKVIVK